MGIDLDFAKLLGFKVTLRALRAAERNAEDRATDGEDGALVNYSAVLRSRIGVKGVPGLRYRRQ
jgi:carbohydrate-selective porin OprB